MCALLSKPDTPSGPVWHRFNGDGYGEHNDGGPFDGTGRGRGWPLLVGERGHYALLAGEDPLPYIKTMIAMTGRAGLLPEQVWDWLPIPEHRLEPGKPSGSAMPLVWTHGEFIKLCYSRALGHPVDRPVATWKRYRGRRPEIAHAVWGPRYRPRHVRAGDRFIVALRAPARVHWGRNGWQGKSDTASEDWGLGHVARLPAAAWAPGDTLDFTFYWPSRNAWQGTDFTITITKGAPS